MSANGNTPWPTTVEAKRRWYAVQTKPRQEDVALVNLERQGYRAYLPRIQLKKRRRDRWQAIIEPLFPGYLFLHVDLESENVAPVRSTLGVRAMVRFGRQCQPLPDEVIDYLHQREERLLGNDSEPDLFKPGDTVRILSGPFAGLEAVYEMNRCEDRVLLLIGILGRQNRVAVSMDDIAPPQF